jgi:NADH-quinone oxidoreductase subunit N
MWNNSLILMKQELMVTILIFILLFIKISSADGKNERILRFVNLLLFVNLLSGFFFQSEGNLFSGMFHSSRLISLEKNMLNLGTLIISLQSYDWLNKNDHVPEFYVILLTTLLGIFFMIYNSNLLIFYIILKL